jgi:UDP-2-acetamido-3-amino-2,3-dideoxy-glucuronate N-acetyltransferase
MRADMTVQIHETAVVEDGAQIGAGTAVWHHAHVRAGSVVGEDCVLGKNVFIDRGAIIGNGVKIQNNVSVFYGVVLEDSVFVGPSAVFTNDRYPRAAGTDWEVVPTLVKAGASIGANATIVCGVTIGEFGTVAAGSVVTKSVEPHELVAGSPAKRLGWVCACGRVVTREVARPHVMLCPTCWERQGAH